jgi:hypothetical protein
MKRIVLVVLMIGLSSAFYVSRPINAVSAAPPQSATLLGPVSPGFGDYWFQGKAELTSYNLEQGRYGEMHNGHAVLIFVTEDFSKSKHVKLDRPQMAGADKVNVLKLNSTRKFNTGIYPYSMMSSVFTPIQRHIEPRTLKVTTSSQEWCGHTFTQMDLGTDSYDVRLHSYFENEGEQALSLDVALLEDEIWNTIRLNPTDLPTGNIKVIPGTLFQRFRHISWTVQEAVAELKPVAASDDMMSYSLHYPSYDRDFSIQFKKDFPHEIQSWEDTYSAGRRGQATTKATIRKRIMLDYWSKNKAKDEILRKELGLE